MWQILASLSFFAALCFFQSAWFWSDSWTASTTLPLRWSKTRAFQSARQLIANKQLRQLSFSCTLRLYWSCWSSFKFITFSRPFWSSLPIWVPERTITTTSAFTYTVWWTNQEPGVAYNTNQFGEGIQNTLIVESIERSFKVMFFFMIPFIVVQAALRKEQRYSDEMDMLKRSLKRP